MTGWRGTGAGSRRTICAFVWHRIGGSLGGDDSDRYGLSGPSKLRFEATCGTRSVDYGETTSTSSGPWFVQRNTIRHWSFTRGYRVCRARSSICVGVKQPIERRLSTARPPSRAFPLYRDQSVVKPASASWAVRQAERAELCLSQPTACGAPPESQTKEEAFFTQL